MLKKYLAMIAVTFLSSCSLFDNKEGGSFCPNVIINRDEAYVTKIVNYRSDFLIELTGYSGYCFFDDRVNRNKAVITPEFKITRLRKSDETEVQFGFFTETLQGPPEYLGRKNYPASVIIPLNQIEKSFTGPSLTLKVPNMDEYRFQILLGLAMSVEERKYNERTFDVRYDYIDEIGSYNYPRPEEVEVTEGLPNRGLPETKAYPKEPVPGEPDCRTCGFGVPDERAVARKTKKQGEI